MKKDLILEIERIREVMGINNSKFLITETSIAKRFSNWIKDTLKGNNPNIRINGRNTPTGTVYNFTLQNTNKVISVTRKEIDDIVNYLENNFDWKDLTSNSKVFLKDLLKESGQLIPEKLYDDIVNGIIQAGSDEKVWLDTILKKASYVDPLTRKDVGLKEALKEVLGDDEGILTDEILASLQKKIDDYQNGFLELKDGKLVRNVVKDVDDFLTDVVKFSDDEIKRLSNPKLVESIKGYFSKIQSESLELKRLFKNYQVEGLEMNEIEQIEKLILKKMNDIANYKLQTYGYMEKFLDELINSKIPEAVKLGEKLKKLADKNGGWDVIKVTARNVSGLRKFWEATKAAMKNAFALERAVGRTFRIDKLGDRVSEFLRKVLRTEVTEKTLKDAEGTTRNTLLMNSPRGWPMRKIVSELDEGEIDYYQKLKSMGGMKLSWISYFEEYLLRIVKFQIEINFLKVVYEKLLFEFGLSDSCITCLQELSKAMKEKNIYDTKFLVKPYQQKAEWLPPCIWEQNQDELTKIFAVADYMTSKDSEDGVYFWGEFKEKMTEMKFWQGILKMQPVKAGELITEIAIFVNQYIMTSDLKGVQKRKEDENLLPDFLWPNTGPSFQLWCENQDPKLVYENWDDTSKIGTASGKKWKLKDDKKGFEENTNSSQTQTTTLSDDEIKILLKDWINSNYPGAGIGTLDLPNMKNLGNNKWEFKDKDENKYTFEFNPNDKTFKML